MKNHPPLIPGPFLDAERPCSCPETSGGPSGTFGPVCSGRNLPGCRKRKELEQIAAQMRSPGDKREAYRQEAAKVNGTAAWAIRHCGGMYFCGFADGRNPNVPKVKWSHSLAEARLFNGSALSQAEKYIERIKAKDSLYVGLKVVKIIAEGQ